MKKLTKIRLINWHYLNNEEIEVDGNILLTGPNASGKSTILDAICFLITAGETQFNLAANDKGKRDLRGYVKCKLGTDEKEYLRDGDVSGHIALEFYDDSLQKHLTIGTVIDAFGDIAPAKVLFYEKEGQIDNDSFHDENGIILNTVSFRKRNDYIYYLTKKEARRGFRIAFGSINDDFFRLIPKALAFKPINDVKDFIYQNILEEKQIDVSNIIDSIRSYKELESTLKVIKSKISDLKIMDSLYTEYKNIEKNKNYYEYLLYLFEQESLRDDVKRTNTKILELEEEKKLRLDDYRKIEQEIDALNERSKELYSVLTNDETFKANEYVERQITKSKHRIDELQESKTEHVRKVSALKEQITTLKKINNRPVYTKINNLPLGNLQDASIDIVKLDLISIDKELAQNNALINQELGKLNTKKEEILQRMLELKNTLSNLKDNRLRYNQALLAIRNEIQNGLRRVYGYDISVHILSELLEVTNPAWHDTVEIYLGNRRFDLIVEPRYFDSALQIFSRVKDNYRLYGIGLVNTKQLGSYNTFSKNSLASIISSENTDAKRYINMTCGNVIMVNSEQELENYPTSVTNTGLSYSRFTVRSMNPNIDKPFIGKNALDEQTKQSNQIAVELREEYNVVTEGINKLKQELDILHLLDIKGVLFHLSNMSELTKEENNLKDLLKRKSLSNEMTTYDLQDDYNKIETTIKNLDYEKAAINQKIGSIISNIKSYEEFIVTSNDLLFKRTAQLNTLLGDNIEFEANGLKEYNECKKTMGIEKALADFKKRLERETDLLTMQGDGIVRNQLDYITKHNSILSIGLSEIESFLKELYKLEKSELVTYEQKVRSAREAAEVLFKEDFLSKLRNNIMTAENEISKINETLKDIHFGNDTYEFIFPKSKEYSAFYEMVTVNFDTSGNSIFTEGFNDKYHQQLEELFYNLSIDEENSKGAINKFTDYRTYMDYDIKITNHLGETMSYSKVFKEKSGGETQVPFYVAILASFVRIYSKSRLLSGDSIGLVLFDEVFDKMDANRMKAMMSFITSMPLQVLIACPPQRMSQLQPFITTTLAMVRKNTKSQVVSVKKKEKEDIIDVV